MKKIISCITTIIIIFLLVLLFVLPKKNFSSNENRYLEKWPKFSVESLLDGSYMAGVESYVEDHFPFRDEFRKLKANFNYKVLGRYENNGIYLNEDGI